MTPRAEITENKELRAEVERLTEKAGWEVEGFIDRLTQRDDTNSERLVLEAISHLRAFSRDCDALREDNQELRAEVERLQVAIRITASEGTYDEMVIRKAVSFELAEIIVEATERRRRSPERIQHELD